MPNENSSAKSTRRMPRSLDDLAGALEGEASQPAQTAVGSEKPRRAPRSLDDLTGTLETEASPPTQPAQTPLGSEKPRRTSRNLDNLAGALEGEANQPPQAAAVSQKNRRTPRSLDEISATIADGTAKNEAAASSDLVAPGLSLPPAIKDYLPPDLWRKLSGGAIKRSTLNAAFERLRSVQYTLSTFMPAQLAQEKIANPVPGLVKGEIMRGSLLFADVSGFTALSERLAVLGYEGAERLTAIINRYYGAMLEILGWSGGMLLKFAGDAALAYFPEEADGKHVGMATRAAMRMLYAMDQFSNIPTPAETVSLKMKVGFATGEFLAASIGGAQRMEYGIWGQAVLDTMAAEGASEAGQLVVNEATLPFLAPDSYTPTETSGFYRVTLEAPEKLGSFEITSARRRARAALPLAASPEEIVAQMELTLRQLQSITPYLASELVERLVAHVQKRQVESEFRRTVVVFCNFGGPEELLPLWGKDGVDRITSMMSAYFNEIHEVLLRYGGVVTRIDPYKKGTKLLVLFGAPAAHEDDPQRAVSAALAMNVELAALNERLKRRFGRFIPADWQGDLIWHRIGITYGDTYAGLVGAASRREYTVMGDDVNLAARLMGAAENNQILLGERIHEKVADYFFFTDLDPIKVKGKTQPVAIHQVEGPRDDTLLNRVRNRPALIGREAELAQCEAFMRQALGGDMTTLILQGPAGIGKSHLADELLQRAENAGARLMLHQCRSYQSEVPYAPWGAVLRSLAGITTADLPQVHAKKLRALLVELNLGEDCAAPIEALMGLKTSTPAATPAKAAPLAQEGGDDLSSLVKAGGRTRRRGSGDIFQQIEESETLVAGQVWQELPHKLIGKERETMFQTVEKVVGRLVDKTPLVIFFEDTQYMDAASRELLEYLDKQEGEKALFVLAAQRVEGEDSLAVGQVMNLLPLSLAGATALVAHILLADLTRLIYEQSNGSPLFVNEITHWLQRTQQIDTSALKAILQTSDVLQKLVLSGLENLPEAQRDIARAAAVIGYEFRLGEVQALLPADGYDPVTLNAHLRTLVETRLFSLSQAGVDARYAYQQAMVRDVLYNSLSFERRRDLHAQLADYLAGVNQPNGSDEGRASGRREVQSRLSAFLDAGAVKNPAQDAERVAYHYEMAERWLDAARHLLNACRHARTLRSYDKMAAAAAHALEILNKLEPVPPDLRAEISLEQGDAALLGGRYGEALPFYEAARKVTGAENQDRLAFGLALALVVNERAPEGVAVLQAARPELLKDEKAAAALAWLLWRQDSPAAGAEIERASTLVGESHSRRSRRLAALLNDLGGNYEEAHRLYSELNEPQAAALAGVRLGDTLLAQAKTDEALKAYEDAAAVWQADPKDPAGLSLGRYRQAEAYTRMKNNDAAISMLNEALTLLASADHRLQKDGREAVLEGIRLVSSGENTPWTPWRWQTFDDAQRLAILVKED